MERPHWWKGRQVSVLSLIVSPQALADDLERRLKNGKMVALAPGVVAGDPAEHKEIKQRLKTSLIAARDEQLQEESVKRFIFDMERPHWWKGRQVSVLSLIVSPQALADDLERRLNAPRGVREKLLRDAVKPYIQFVTNERDEHTNLRLVDIWRYCRYTWSLPYYSTPGRRMQYLIRDAARDYHPIIGIGALGSSIMQISSRDERIGWSYARISDMKDEPNIASRIKGLRHEIDHAIRSVYWEDLLTLDEIEKPNDDTTRKLNDVIEKLTITDGLTSRIRSGERQEAAEESLLEISKSPLYLRKRAVALLALIKAKIAFQKAEVIAPDEPHAALFSTESGRNAVRTALREVKKRHIGSSMMDITTCGALPPYSQLLGGKLVSALMASPQVIADYAERYELSESVIASRMKGEELVRPSQLVLLGTTSLYGIGSSQYNRIRVPTALGSLRYEKAGVTRGFGSVHLSYRTYSTVQDYLRSGNKEHSNRFAAGVNFKMRSIATALAMIGLTPLLKHENRRLVYMVPLATNWREYLTGQTEDPNYIYDDVRNPDDETKQLIDHWRDRWFLPRVQRPEVLHALRTAGKLRVSDAVTLKQPLFEEAVHG
ncbi:hypothetical protein CTI14_04480 [Methylobacterium radiotolerans]|nr:hypothetical protein CTI14_04480 [Methylobacterium radiotolerans]